MAEDIFEGYGDHDRSSSPEAERDGGIWMLQTKDAEIKAQVKVIDAAVNLRHSHSMKQGWFNLQRVFDDALTDLRHTFP